MPEIRRAFPAALVLLALYTLPARAQDPGHLWLSAGLGAGFLSDGGGEGFAGRLALTQELRGFVVTLRTATVAALFSDGLYDVGLLAGPTWLAGRSRASLSAGLSYVDGEERNGLFGSAREFEGGFGVPLEASYLWLPSRSVGLGTTLFADLNGIRTVVGMVISIELGALR